MESKKHHHDSKAKSHSLETTDAIEAKYSSNEEKANDETNLNTDSDDSEEFFDIGKITKLINLRFIKSF